MPQMMTLNGVRTLLLLVVVALLGGVRVVRAQQSEPSTVSVERIRAALQSPQQSTNSNGVPPFAPSKPDEFHWDILTFVPPDAPGQFVSVKVPIGDLVSRAAHSVAAAQHRRAENAAHAEVVKALADFQATPPK
jgi:hypothetical protein